MMRINLALFMVLVVCALALVTSQHRARKLFTELEQEQAIAKQIEVEWGQMHSRVEKIASGYLQMRAPPPDRVRLVPAGATQSRSQP
jgi:cell division protein FtsL